jgi:hypothetical protein
VVSRLVVLALLLPASSALAVPDTCDPSPPPGGNLASSNADVDLVGRSDGDRHGQAIATADLDGDGELDLIVGAPGDDVNGAWSGRVAIFYGPLPATDTSASAADLVLTGPSGSRTGWSVANAGDLDGDGFDDLAVGAPALGGMGGVFVLYGGSRLTGLHPIQSLADGIAGPVAGSGFGTAIASAGDLDGDGLADLAVGAPRAEGGVGTAFVFYGPASANSAPQADVMLRGPGYGSEVGYALAGLGDWNGDGYDDLAVGAPGGLGAVHVLHGAPNLPRFPVEADLRIEGPAGFRAGHALAALGDVNGDGLTDLALGAPGVSTLNDAGTGAVMLFLGNVAHGGRYDLLDADQRVMGNAAGLTLGSSLATVEADGTWRPELLVGAIRGRGTVTAGGAAFLFDLPLAPGATADDALARFAGTTPNGQTGRGLAALPDLNGDGYPEIAVGGPLENTSGNVRTGRVGIYFGGEDVADLVFAHADADGDGFGAPGTWIDVCGLPPGYVEDDRDCDDTNHEISPAATEVCDDAIDQDCDGRVDCVGLPGSECPPHTPLVSSSTGPVPTVTDIAVEAGTQTGPNGVMQRGRACMAADFDLDGRTDLYVGNPSDASYVLRNITQPGQALRFAAPSVILQNHLSWGGAAADYDKDGDLDMFLTGGGNEGRDYNILMKNLFVETGTLQFLDVGEDIRGIRMPDGRVLDGASANMVWADFDRDGDADAFVSGNISGRVRPVGPVGRNTMWRNDDGAFTDVTALWNLDDSLLPTRHSTAFDYDNDGDMDLYENNFLADNVLYRNNLVETGIPSFSDVTAGQSTPFGDLREPRRSFASMAGDLNNDGWEDLVVLSRGVDGSECGNENGTDGDAGFEEHAMFLNLGNGRGFVQVADAAGITYIGVPGYQPRRGDGVMGCQIADLDANGLIDLVVGNGGPTTGGHNDFFAARSLQRVSFGALGEVDVPVFENWSALIDYPATPGPNVASVWPEFPYRTHAICAADFDGDGLLELVETNGGPASWPDTVREPDRMFKFEFEPAERPRHFIIALRGDGEDIDVDAIGGGATITVRDPDGTTRSIQRRLYAGSAFSAQNGFDLFFGLGPAVAIEGVTVRWADGLIETIAGPFALDSRIVVQR